MKYFKKFRILAVIVTLTLILVLVPASPVLAQSLILRPDHGEVGTWVDIDGSGFDEGEQVRFCFAKESASDGDIIDEDEDVENFEYLGSRTANDNGTFDDVYTFKVPDELNDGKDVVKVVGGTYYVYATDYYFVILAKKSFTVEGVAAITIDDDEGIVGTEVEITGEGFDNNEDIYVEYDGDEIDIESGDTDTDSDGEFECTIIIPESTAGEHTITVIGEDSDLEAEAEFTVEPEVTISATSGAAGDTVNISGTGFGDEVDVEVLFDNDEVVTDETDRDGSFYASFQVPAIGSGTYDVDVEDDDGNDASVEFTIATATISINPTEGNINSTITVTGTGFKSNTSVTISFDNESVATSTSNEYGGVSGSFNIPVRGAGTYKVKVSDGTNAAQVDFVISTSTSISPVTSTASPGYIGTAVTVSGTGYVPATAVTVTYGGTQVATTTVDTNGNFSATFNVPVSTGGTHDIIANIGTTSKTYTFYMEQTPPSLIYPQLPFMYSEMEDWRFDWCGDQTDLTKEVTDQSPPITYTLQIATSQDFSQGSIVFERTGLTESEYTLTKEEELESREEEQPYYWRVMAIDGASNEGAWSGVGEFFVKGGFSWNIPRPVLITLIVIGVLVLAVLGFWFGRKTAYY